MSSSVEVARRSRPRDRKQRIAAAAAVAFAERGYHQVSMSDVAAAVGISAPALYRHYPNKYALFAEAAFLTAHRLLEDTESFGAEPPADRDAALARLDGLLDAVIATTIELRASGGLYRWEGRYLERDDRMRLTAEFSTLRERLLVPFAVARPGLSDDDRGLLVWGALSVVASITAHRTTLAAAALADLLRDAAWRVLESDPLPRAPAREPVAGIPAAGRRERLVTEAIALFARRGYHDTSIEEIATAVELTPSGVYRHFPSKAAILLEACERAAERLEDGMGRAREAASARDAVHLAATDYVRRSVENQQLIRVYFADLGSLAVEDQRRLRTLQRAYVAEWAELLGRARPELSTREATVLVHAGFGVVADLLVLPRRGDRDLEAPVTRLLELVLGAS